MVETFWSAGTPSRTRLRRTFPPPLRQPALCSASPDSLYCAGQPVLLPQQVHQRCVPSQIVVKKMTILTVDEHVIVVFIVILSLESI